MSRRGQACCRIVCAVVSESILFQSVRRQQNLRMSGTVNVGHDQPIWHAVKGNRALHGSLDASLARFPNFTLSHQLNSLEEMDFGLVARVAVYVQCNCFNTGAIADRAHDVEGIIQERSVDHVSRSPVLGA